MFSLCADSGRILDDSQVSMHKHPIEKEELFQEEDEWSMRVRESLGVKRDDESSP